MKRLDVPIICLVLSVIVGLVGCAEVQKSTPEASSYYKRGLSFHKEGKYDQAITNYTKAIEINPRLAQAYTNRGAVYLSTGKTEPACDDFRKACELGVCHALNLAKENGNCR